MLCHQCGSPVDTREGACANCGAELKGARRLKLTESRGLRISQELKAIRLEAQLFPPGEEVAKRFVLGEMLGKGPFGEVYRARDTAIDAEVAVKIFAAEVLKTPLDEERFLQATRAGRRLTQQNVVRLHDSGVHKSHPWVSMQLLEGLSLRKVLDLRKSKNETFTLAELEPVVTQVTLALQHVSRDFPHGDLKPENIVFLPELIKMTDSFLLAALPAKAIIPRLRENPYFAPELHAEKTDPTPRADVYSVGVIIGEMMFGPDYTPGSRSGGELGGVDALVKRATAFDPSERYPSVEALSEDLATLIDTGSLLEKGATGPAAFKPPPPPPRKATPTLPPAPPPGPAPSEASEAEEVATVEYNRDLAKKLQDDILTREVGRTVPAGTSRTVTAAVPKPSGPIPAPRPVQSDASLKTGLIVGVVVSLLVAGGVLLRPSGDVEHIGEPPVEIGESPKPPTPAPVEPVVVADAPSVETTAQVALDKVGVAQGAAVAALIPPVEAVDPTPEQTNGTTTPDVVEPVPVKPVKPDAVKTVETPTKVEKPVATGTDCAGGMKLVKSSKIGNYCIDAYEYPGSGSVPKTGVTWFQAKKSCESAGKRLCELKEWRAACGSKYPYGTRHKPDGCNTADEDGFERSAAKSGAFKDCRSRSGTYDMVGNAHEWVEEQRIAGGGYESDEDVGSCRYSSPKSPGSSAAYIGFRCCASPN